MSLLRPPAIHILPTELVREIVRACCDSYVDIILPFPDPKSPAIPLSQFCSRWRAVAHNEPALWRNFRVDLPDELHGGQYEALMNFLANGAPANSTCLWLRQGAYRPPDLNPLLPIVVSFAHCLRFLSLELPGQSVEQLFSISALLLHHLERLSVAVRVTDEKDISFLETPDDHVSQIFTTAPLLTGVTIGYDKLMPITLPSFPLSPWHFPRGQLTEFDASNIWIDVNQFFFILDCPNLVTCIMTLDAEGGEEPETDDKVVTLAHLRTLHLTFLELYSWVWSNVTLPSLVDLKIAAYRDETAWEDDEFLDFMARSGCSLTHLALCFGFLDVTDAMIRIFDQAPELHELALRWTRLPGEDDADPDAGPLMDYLAFHPHTRVNLPSLRRICIDAAPESLRMLVSRCRAPDSALREAVLYAEQPSTCEALFTAEIGALQSAGVAVACERTVFQLREIYDPVYASSEAPSPSSWADSDTEIYPLLEISEGTS
ncbi:hypothetical protein DFH08DRAFT_1084572 [Mycena albidolilacea]|uniref:F-box domain-containing protein n=1 Tax=Mycena albidolilacea TaxID=1033008 RepID=A0AAD6ZLY8_9AGAR|nr:hypothetical protein DFH08DRAFT_1084572 [Mycena albidolilacea]